MVADLLGGESVEASGTIQPKLTTLKNDLEYNGSIQSVVHTVLLQPLVDSVQLLSTPVICGSSF